MSMNVLEITTISGGSLRAGDVITFEGVRWWPWYKRIWYHLRYMRHNNPMFKPQVFRQFIVTEFSNAKTAQIAHI